MKKKNIYIYVNPFFLFILQMYFHKNISLYKKRFFFYLLTYSLISEIFPLQLLCRCTVCLSSRLSTSSPVNPFGVQRDTDTGSLPFAVLSFFFFLVEAFNGHVEPAWALRVFQSHIETS